MSTQDTLSLLEQQWLQRGQVLHARATLRRVLARRGLELGDDDEARIDDCRDLDTLERWLDQAVTATTVAEALT